MSPGFRLGCAAIKPKKAFVVHGGRDEWPMPAGVTAISLAGMMRRLSRAR